MVHLQQSSVMRALILLRWKTLDKDFRVSLRSLHAVSVHDVSILSEMLFDVVRYGEPRDRFFHSAIFRRLGRWYAYYPTGTAPLHEVTRQHILLNSNLFIQSRQGDDSFHLDDEPAHALLRLISQGTLSSPESKAVLRFLAQIDFDFDVNAIIDRLAPSAIKLPTMLWSCFLLTTGRTFMFPSLRDYCWKLYTSSLEQLSLSSRTTNWPLDYVECCLAPFAVDGATQLDWKLSDILAALSVLVQAVLHANDRPNVWSEARNRLLRGLLKHRRKIDNDVDGFQWKVSIMLSQLSLSTHHGVLSKLEAHSARGSYIRHTAVNILSRGRSEDGISTFELFKVVHALKLAKPLMVELAILSHHSLAGLLAPDDDLGELLYALAGGDRCIQLALADTKEFVITASHGRVISGHWWENAKARLLNLTEERWRTRNRNFQHETPEALVDEIEAREACEVCAATIIKARQILDAAATVDSTSSVPHRPHELGGDGAMDGAAPPDAAVAASPNGWRRRTGYLLQSLGIPVHHPPGDTEMRPRGRIETV
ncbi:hypothetical protein BKA62DRAFT_716823 [Auriculariales sp. MPI-PUGE-AT-0066]|nr:hypothetical protein BKA62DRAFT_716823 [Auriculariales sp. MPI-PUGE-AT-0066]